MNVRIPSLALLIAALPLTLLGVTLPACDDDDDKGPATSQQYVDRLTTVYCADLAACCESKGLPIDREGCPDALGATAAEFLDATKYRYDAANGAACLNAYAKLPPACAALDRPEDGGLEACNDVFHNAGTKARAEACQEDWECAEPDEPGGSAYCSSGDGSGQGPATSFCFQEVQSSAGGRCDEDFGGAERVSYYCDSSTYCESSSSTCQPRIALGGSCPANTFDACAGLAFCNEQGTCEAPRAAGAPCPQGNECGNELRCDDTRVCAPRRAAGEACVFSDECQSFECGTDKTCAPDDEDDFAETCALEFG